MSNQKFCKDCKWAKRPSGLIWFSGWLYARCTQPDLLEADEDYLVTGKLMHGFHCSTNRAYGCGSEGKLWEKRDE